jgi:amidohydrolase
MHGEDHITSFRKELHRHPELSGEEHHTSMKIAAFLQAIPNMEVQTGIGGFGILAKKVYGPGPTIAFRAELDGLPIAETSTHDHISQVQGHSHACGHDGHMSILLRLVEKLEKAEAHQGSLFLIYQPAEETGEGAQAMIDAAAFDELDIGFCYALHNIPGKDMGTVYMREDTFACASVGLRIDLKGRTAHAAHPEKALNPLPAASKLLKRILEIPAKKEIHGFALATPISLQSGDENYGTSPERAALMFTLRAAFSNSLDEMVEQIRAMVEEVGQRESLEVKCTLHEYFPATVNHAHSIRLQKVCENIDVPWDVLDEPFRWSEDFGRFGKVFPIAMFGLGSGMETSALHAPDYDFPDELIEIGSDIFYQLYKSHFD